MSQAPIITTTTTTTNTTMPKVGLGTWKSQPGQVQEIVYQAIKAGYRMIDCAPLYGNEREVGNGVQRAIQDGLVVRSDLFLVSKIWNNAHRPDNLRQACDATLHDLQVDYVDVMLIHWPVAFQVVDGNIWPKDTQTGHCLLDKDITIEQTWSAMESLVSAGKAREIGVSNFSISEMNSIFTSSTTTIMPSVCQVEIHAYFPQEEMLQYCKSNNMRLMAYCPLGNVTRPGQEAAISTDSPLQDPVIIEIAKELGVSPAQVLIAWNLIRGVVVLPKTTNIWRLSENLASLEVVCKLTTNHISSITALGVRNLRMVNPSMREDGKQVF